MLKSDFASCLAAGVMTLSVAFGPTSAVAQEAPAATQENPAPAQESPSGASTGGYSIFAETMVDMSWPEVEKLAKPETLVIFPTGVVEQHGPHLSLGTDVYGSYMQSKLLKRELESRGIAAIIAPPFYWGINGATGSWPGSFTSRPSTVKAVIEDALASLEDWGFTNVVFLNHHGDPDHNQALLEAIKEARLNTGIRAYYLATEFNAERWGLKGRNDVLISQVRPGPNPAPTYVDRHAAGGETNEMAYYFPETVDMDLARTLKPTEVTWEQFQTWLEGWTVSRGMTPLGYVGDPAAFDAEKGKVRTEEAVDDMANVIEGFISGTYKPGEVMK